MVFGTVGTGDYGSVIGMDVVASREPSYWVGKGLGEGAGKEQGEVSGKEQERVLMLGKLGADIQDVAEWAEERCSVGFAS